MLDQEALDDHTACLQHSKSPNFKLQKRLTQRPSAPLTQLAFSPASFQSGLQPSLLNINFKSTRFWTRLSTSSAIVTTGLDNIEALDPRSVFPGGSRKFLQFPTSPRLAPNLASSAVPRFQPLQAVATCSPHLVRSSAPPLVQDQRAALLCNWQCYEVLVNVVTKSLVSPQRFLATMPTTKCLFSPIALSRQPRYQQWLAPQCLIVPASFFNNLEGCPAMLTMVMPTIVFNTTRFWRFLTGESPLANWLIMLLAACILKQVKMGHRICPEMPVAPKSGALPSTDLANLLVLAP